MDTDPRCTCHLDVDDLTPFTRCEVKGHEEDFPDEPIQFTLPLPGQDDLPRWVPFKDLGRVVSKG